MSKDKLKIEYVDIESIKLNDFNPRKTDREFIEQLKASITSFNICDPLIVNGAPNRSMILIGGHQRYTACKELGITKVPIVKVFIPEIEREAELCVRLNRVGYWDFEKLKKLNFQMLLDVGFNDSELSAMFDDIVAVEDDDFDEEKAIEEIKEPKTKYGQLILLDNHRLICSDSSNPETVKRLVGDEKIDVFYTDPNYNIGLSYDKGIGGKQRYGGKKTNDKKSEEEYRNFLQSLVRNGLSVAKENSHFFMYCDEGHVGMIQNIYAELGIDYKRTCFWIKNNMNPTPNVAFNKVTESVVYGTRGDAYLSPNIKNLNEVINRDFDSGNRLIDDIYDQLNIWMVKRVSSIDYSHPTIKPPSLHEKPLRRCSRPGDIVMDLTAGSGSLLIAADQLGRRAFLSEYEPIFCDLIIKRYLERRPNAKIEIIG